MKNSARIIRVAVLTLAVVSLSQPANAQRRRPHRRAAPVPSLDVVPSPEIEARVSYEIAKARQILADLSTANLLESPYVVSAVYYHDGFLTGFPVDKPSADPERRIIGKISSLMKPEDKARFIRLLHDAAAQSGIPGKPILGVRVSDPPAPERFVAPVIYSVMSGGRHTHLYAVDLFAAEGSPVHSASGGLVILADHDWTPADPFSAASRKGGNAVIVFDPGNDRFYRYCHMSTVVAQPGDAVEAGQVIGRVGHTGFNASRAGHGRHLHFESNEYLDGKVRAIDYRRLRAMLRSWPRASEVQKVVQPAETAPPTSVPPAPPER